MDGSKKRMCWAFGCTGRMWQDEKYTGWMGVRYDAKFLLYVMERETDIRGMDAAGQNIKKDVCQESFWCTLYSYKRQLLWRLLVYAMYSVYEWF